MGNEIKIYYKELDKVEKADKFRELFGKNKYMEVLDQLSEKIYGDGKLELLEHLAQNSSDDFYEQLRPEIKNEMDKLQPRSDAYVFIDVSEEDVDFIIKHKRELFKEYLGEDRFYEAIGLTGKECAQPKTLLKINQNVASYASRKKRERLKKKYKKAERDK